MEKREKDPELPLLERKRLRIHLPASLLLTNRFLEGIYGKFVANSA
jgi:hypothetical protein